MFLRCLCARRVLKRATPSYLRAVRESMLKSRALSRRHGNVLEQMILRSVPVRPIAPNALALRPLARVVPFSFVRDLHTFRKDKHLFETATKLMPDDEDIANARLRAGIKGSVFKRLNTMYDEAFALMTTAEARKLSQLGRETNDNSRGDLTYGEVTFPTLAKILCVGLPKFGIELKGTFYDLGSGSGRGVIAAALLGNFDNLRGVELVKELHKAAVGVKRVYESKVQPQFGTALREQKINFQQGDFLKSDWSDGDVIFINSTCFSQVLVSRITKMGAGLKPGACIITLTHTLNSPYFEVLESSKYKFTWGEATVHIHVRTAKKNVDQGARKAYRYWSKGLPGNRDYGSLFDGYTSA